MFINIMTSWQPKVPLSITALWCRGVKGVHLYFVMLQSRCSDWKNAHALFREAGVSQHNGVPIEDPLKPCNTIVL